MSAPAPVWRDTYATFAEALNLHPRTIKTLVSIGQVRCVRLCAGKKPIVRLEPPAEYIARQGKFSHPEPEPAK
jgi:hypothetical protein